MYRGELDTTAAQAADTTAHQDDGTCVEALIRGHGDALLRFLRRHLPPGEEADDIAQEVYARLSRKPDLAQVRHPQAFLFQTAVNLLRDKARRARVRERSNHVSLEEALHASEAPSQERVIAGRQRLSLFEAVLAELPPRCRHVFVLHRFEALTYTQIAARLGITKSAVEKHMMRAIAHFDERMGDDT